MKQKIVDFYNSLDQFNKVSLILIIIITIILILWSIISIIIQFINPTNKCIQFKKVESLQLFETSKNAQQFQIIKNNKLLSKLSNGEYTFSIWLYIDQWYNTNKTNKWKHIFHMGSIVKNNSKTIDLNWNTLSYQTPGIWLLPNINNIRLVFTTERKQPYMNSKIIELEYCDLENVEIKNWFNISFTVEANILDIYYNGKLKKSKILNGVPRINKNVLYVSYNKGFPGLMKKLEIIPKKVNPNVINRIYQLQ